MYKRQILAPADGKIVVIEETEEPEYFKDRRLQVSIFMNIFNVHINWFPVNGVIKYFKYHKGNFAAAYLPKSSTENERTTIVIECNNGKTVLMRQIAGAMAKRIVSYAPVGGQARQDQHAGFIKFGSRVDLFLPLGTQIEVKLGQKTTGSQTIIGTFKSVSYTHLDVYKRQHRDRLVDFNSQECQGHPDPKRGGQTPHVSHGL